MTLKLYLVRRTDVVGYPFDEYDAHIVRAEDQTQARSLVPHADEGAALWQSDKVEVTEITTDGPVEVLLSSFNRA